MGSYPRSGSKGSAVSPLAAAISSAKVAPKVGRGKSGVRGVSKELLQNTESVKIREAAVNQTVKAVLSSGFRLNNKLQQSHIDLHPTPYTPGPGPWPLGIEGWPGCMSAFSRV